MSPEFVRYLSDPSSQINFFISDVFSFGLVVLNLCTFQKFHAHERANYINDDQNLSKRLNEMTNSIAEDDAVWGTNQIIRQLLLEMIEVDCKKRKDFRQINETWQKLKLQNQTLKSRISESLVSDPKIQKDKEKDEKKNQMEKILQKRLKNLNIKKTEPKLPSGKQQDSYQLLDLSEYNSNSEAAQFGLLILSQRFSASKQSESINDINHKLERPSFSINKIQYKAPNILIRNSSQQKQQSNSQLLNSYTLNKKNSNEQKKLPQLNLKTVPVKQKQGVHVGKLKKLLNDQLSSKEFSDNQFNEGSTMRNESFLTARSKILAKNLVKLCPLVKIT